MAAELEASALVRVTLAAFGLFYLPGALLARALGAPVASRVERIAVSFVLSLAMVVPAAALGFALGAGALETSGILLAFTLAAALAWALRGPIGELESSASALLKTGGGTERVLRLLVIALMAVLTAGAMVWTARGSVDRWWYLAYVRAWVEGPLQFAEPFLASGHVHPRFALNAWLAALAMWARLAGVDPVWLYERACPALLVPIAFAAQVTFGRALFGSARGGLLTALCAALLWAGGGPIAVLSRIPEDKVLASVVLTPVLWATAVHHLDDGVRGWGLLLAAAALALCTVHPVTFVFAATSVGAYTIWVALRSPERRLRAAAVALVLVLTSSYPLVTGVLARGEYAGEGAGALSADHPVARVHRARDRLIDARGLGYVVDPRLLAHPVAVVGLVALALLPLRSARERRFLAPAALVPLAIAFVPPLAASVGAAILPWMVHRALWTLPLGALAAIAVDEGARRFEARRARVVAPATPRFAERATLVAALVLIAASAAPAARAVEARSRDERVSAALPDDLQLDAVLAAVRGLPAGAIVAAAPQLSERLPALTGARVLAMSDRATIAFTGAREPAEARLRARAAIFAGLWKPSPDVPKPTHVLFARGSAAARYCAEPLLDSERFVLCAFGPSAPAPGIRMPEAPSSADGGRSLKLADALATSATEGTASASCVPAPRASEGLVWPRPSPWSASFAAAVCEIRGDAGRPLGPRTLVLRPLVGTAVEELTIQATGERDGEVRWRVRTRVRVHDRETLRFALPRGEVGTVHVEVIPSFLPFLKLAAFELTLDDPRAGGTADRPS